jgi:hypothetical protein
MQSWESKHTGKGLYFTIFFFFSIIFFIVIILRSAKKCGVTNFDELLQLSLISIPLFMLWIWSFSKFIFHKIIPVRISFNELGNELIFEFSNHKIFQFPTNEISFTFFEYENYDVLIFNKIIHSTRGHLIHKEWISMVGMDSKLGWNRDDLKSLSTYLNSISIKNHLQKDKSFLIRIIQ